MAKGTEKKYSKKRERRSEEYKSKRKLDMMNAREKRKELTHVACGGQGSRFDFPARTREIQTVFKLADQHWHF